MRQHISSFGSLFCLGRLRGLFGRPSPGTSHLGSFDKSESFGSSASLAPSKSITVVTSPYHVGIRGVGVGEGPKALINAGLLNALRDQGIIVHEVELDPVDDFEGEIGKSFELLRRTSVAITKAINNGSFPIVLAGNSSATVGVAAGISASHQFKFSDDMPGCIWFDAHDDFNIPDTIFSGYFDSMGVSMLGDKCWKALLHSIPGFRALDLKGSFVQCGMRDVTELQRSRVEEEGFSVIWGSTQEKVDFTRELQSTLAKKNIWHTMVHLDLDCLDASIGRANKFAAPGGLFRDDLADCLRMVPGQTRPLSLTIGSYDPSCDLEAKIIPVAVDGVVAFVKGLIFYGILGPKLG